MLVKSPLYHNDFVVSELKRRLNNVVKVGVVSEINPEKAKVRIKVGDLHSDWRPWTANSKHQWDMPDVGDSAVMISPNGETEKSIIIPSLYNDQNPPPSTDADTICWQIPEDKTFVISVGSSKIEMTAKEIRLKSDNVIIDD